MDTEKEAQETEVCITNHQQQTIHHGKHQNKVKQYRKSQNK